MIFKWLGQVILRYCIFAGTVFSLFASFSFGFGLVDEALALAAKYRAVTGIFLFLGCIIYVIAQSLREPER